MVPAAPGGVTSDWGDFGACEQFLHWLVRDTVSCSGYTVEWQLVEQLLPLEWLGVVVTVLVVRGGGAAVRAGDCGCPPFVFHLDSISKVHGSSLHLDMCFGLHVKSGKAASAIDSGGISYRLKGHSSFCRTPPGSFSWSAQGVAQLQATASGD